MLWKRHVDQIRKCDVVCGLEFIKPRAFDNVPMNAPLESREDPINSSAGVLNSKDSFFREQSTGDDRNLPLHHENISQTKPQYSHREHRRLHIR